MPAHADEQNLQEQVASTLKRASDAGYYTDAIELAATTREGLKAGINAVASHADQTNFKIQLARAVDFTTDANIAASSTVAALIATTGITSPGTAILE